MSNLTVLPNPGYNAQVVECLETMLAEARCGEIVSLIAVTELRGGLMGVAWTGCDDLFRFAGYASHLQHLIQRRIDATRDTTKL